MESDELRSFIRIPEKKSDCCFNFLNYFTIKLTENSLRLTLKKIN